MKNITFIAMSIVLVGFIWTLVNPRRDNQKVSLAVNTSPTPTIEESPTITPTVSVSNGKVQIIKATYGPPFGFLPTELKAKAGSPVRLEVYSNVDGRGCMGSIMIPQLAPNNIQFFGAGRKNIFEFTPTSKGTYPITCAMGIPHANLIVE